MHRQISTHCDSRAACAAAASALAAIARPGGPPLHRAQVQGGWDGNAGLSRLAKAVEFGDDAAAAASDAGDALQKRPRAPADGDAAAAPRVLRHSAPKLADVRGSDLVAAARAVGGAEADAHAGGKLGSSDNDDDGGSGDEDDIPDVVLESADESE